MGLSRFHPATAAWFSSRFEAPTEPQTRAWAALGSQRHVLLAAPTGSGKTLAAFLAALDDLVREGLASGLPDETRVVYVSPLRALSNDIHRNLEVPLAGIRARLETMGLPAIEIRAAVRTGDTAPSERAATLKRPPHVLVTTPESLYVLLTSERGRRMLATTRSVIVDEVHALVASKRGSHLALTLERLEHVAQRRLVRIGLSATQRPIEDVARFLVGSRSVDAEGRPDCEILDFGHRRRLDVAVEVPRSPLQPVMANEVWTEVYDRIADLVRAHRTTLVFVNTRRVAERAARALSERLGEDVVTSHHGSMAKEHRHAAEQRLKAGTLRALVATSSLELGIDIGDVDLVVQLGAVRSISAFLQRVGRSGHAVLGTPKGRLFPLTRDELITCGALMLAVAQGDLDTLEMPEQPLDLLAQQIVAEVASEDWPEDALFDLVRRAWPYRNLARKDFDEVVTMLADGFTTRRGRRSAHVHHDAVNGRLRGRRGARLLALTNGGAIPDLATYDVILEPAGQKVGTLDEDFAIESMAGDIFQLGNTSWRILRVEAGRVRVQDAHGAPPTMPFWLGEAPARSDELSACVSRVRAEVERRLDDDDAAMAWLTDECGLPAAGARQVVDYLRDAKAALGVIPTRETLVLERFFDEAGSMQLVLHAPLGSRINRAWGLALRKRFCRAFNFELQAAATEDAIVLSLGPTHSFPLEDVFSFLHSNTARDVLIQALIQAPLFGTRWRWVATRSLAVPRQRGGKRMPPALQRILSEDLLALVFPDQVACPENLTGPPEIPDHPLVRQAVDDCLQEAMDARGFEELLRSIERGERRLVACDLPTPSALSAEILDARPYAFLDDAPLEERRTRAVQQRRVLDTQVATTVGALDPAAVEQVRMEAWPDARDADELHDALCLLGFLTQPEGERSGWQPLFEQLVAARRATRLHAGGLTLWIAAERIPHGQAALGDARLDPAIEAPPRSREKSWTPETAAVEIVRSRLEGVGPTTQAELAATSGLAPFAVEQALLALEREGFVLRGRFTPADAGIEWCERRLLARIHRLTLDRLRREVEPATTVDVMRFLAAWHRVDPERRLEGVEGLAGVVDQLCGFEAAASAWESDVLPSRVSSYEPAWLDMLCLTGRVAWARAVPPRGTLVDGESRRGPSPVRATPIAFGPRARLSHWLRPAPESVPTLSPSAAVITGLMRARGAMFLPDVASAAGLLMTQAEEAIAELVGAGLVTCDGFEGLRALLRPSSDRAPSWRTRSAIARPLEAAGRWSLVPRPDADAGWSDQDVEVIARGLLRRHGVLFRALLVREEPLPPWRDLLRVLWRLEARGEIRGGRFVDAFGGEQFALPEAVALLRALRREPRPGRLVSLSASDPLNLVGVITPGRRLPSLPGNRVLLRDGEPVAVLEANVVRWLAEIDEDARWDAEKILRRGPLPSRTRPGSLRGAAAGTPATTTR